MRTIFVRWIFLCIGILAISLVLLGVQMTSSKDDSKAEFKRKMFSEPLCLLNLKEKLVELSKEIKKTSVHIRGKKSRESLIKAMTIVNNLLKMTNTSINSVKRKTKLSEHVCNETYKGTTYGYPFFYQGFETTNCTYAKPIDELVTVVLLHDDDNMYNLTTILRGISNYNKQLKVLIGAKNKIEITQFDNVNVLVHSKSETHGAIFNTLIKSVNTEYVLILRNITMFNIDARLDRLVREIESLDITVVAGASRDENGHWKLGCYQSAYKNYSLVYSEGYDESLHECIFCDYVDASFITKTKTLLKYSLDEKMNGVALFLDFFLRLSEKKLESVVCADSMFYMHKEKLSNNLDDWNQFSKKWELFKMIFSDEISLEFKCKKPYSCFNGLGHAVTPCCLQELADMVKFIMKTCEDNNIICELQEGTLLGAVKLHKVLPWERDADLTFLTSNFTAFTKLKKFITENYSYSDDAGSLWCCVDNRTAGGKISVHSKNWHIELYGQHIMDSEMLLIEGIKPTKVLFDGQWVGVPRNPGWHARNRYGHEIYAHAQHWMSMGKGDGWINYETNIFTACETPGRNDCLDNFNADGNLQFGLPIP